MKFATSSLFGITHLETHKLGNSCLTISANVISSRNAAKEIASPMVLAQMVNDCLKCGRPGFNLRVGKISWRRKWQPTPVFLPEKSHKWRNLVGYSPCGRKELDMTERLHFLYGCVEKESTWQIINLLNCKVIYKKGNRKDIKPRLLRKTNAHVLFSLYILS